MAHLQRQFDKFHETIKLKRYDENQTLREKRDIVVDKVRTKLPEVFEDKEESTPTFALFNQGSYAMGVGVQPLDGDYDIDVGLRFHVSREDHDPYDVKEWVYETLKDHTHDVGIRECCVRVNYVGEYHVDLAIYASAEKNDDQDYLARGFKGSSDENKLWEPSDVREFIAMITGHLSGDEGRQFRRIIRYLKRWTDYQFTSNGNAAPVGIAITILAYDHFTPRFVNLFSGREARDLKALRNLVTLMLSSFRWTYHDADDEWAYRLRAEMPVTPHDDVLSSMSNRQMKNFKSRLQRLKEALADAEMEPEPHDAASKLEEQFGDDFPVPEPEESAKKSSRKAMITHSSSA